MRRSFASLSLALLLCGCQVQLPAIPEGRFSAGEREVPIPPPQAPAAAAPAAPVEQARPAPVAPAKPAEVPRAAEPVAKPPEPAAQPVAEPVPPEAPDASEVLGTLRAYVDAYRMRDPARVAEFEAALLGARRRVDAETESQFRWSIERGHAEVFVKAHNLRVVTAELKNIELKQAGDTLTVKTRDGSPLLHATFELNGTPGTHRIAELVFKRGADGKVRLASLPLELAGPLGEAGWQLPDLAPADPADRDAALAAIAALNDAYARRDAKAVAALLANELDERARRAGEDPAAFRERWLAQLTSDFADPLFSVQPIAKELLKVGSVGGQLIVAGPRPVIASFPLKRGDAVSRYVHGVISLRRGTSGLEIVGSCDGPQECGASGR